MKVVHSSKEFAAACGRFHQEGLSLGLVPTMGALHAGHLSLVQAARRECDRVAVSIFVNPTQFGPREDLENYPSSLEKDLENCRREGVDLVLVGAKDDMYPEGFQTWVTVEEVSRRLCGASRPTHFRGVATVVTQLLNLARPQRAYFGQKDYQQTLVVRRLVRDLHVGTEIRTCPTVREADGLAMSSRNAYLDERARAVAPRIYEALGIVQKRILGGERRLEELRRCLLHALAPGEELVVDYAEILQAETLREFPDALVSREPHGIVVAVAARVGGARLIDNVLIPPSRSRPE